MARVVYTGVNGQHELNGSLFGGQRFWFSQKVPQRKWFIEQVEVFLLKSHGGVVVPLEKQADIKLVDHTRKDLPPDTYSYKYVEVSIRKGQLEELKDHAAGPPAGTIRSVGSTVIPSKRTRSSFSSEDDQVLWDWVTTHKQKGGYIQGNEIYKQLEVLNPRHPWQSWRDRWITTLSSRPRPTKRAGEVALTPRPEKEPRMRDERVRKQAPVTSNNKKHKLEFTPDDAKDLLEHAEHILAIESGSVEETWEAWAKANPEHTAEEWQDFFEKTIRPLYEENLKKSTKRQVKTGEPSLVSSPRSNQKSKISLMVSPLPSRKKQATSPEFVPQTPSPWSTQAVESPSLNDGDQPQDIWALSSRYARKEAAHGGITPKRKRDSFEEVASSSPLKPDPPTFNKRPRYQNTDEQVIEIPSTPERGPTPMSLNPPSQSDNWDQVIDLEDDDNLLGLPASQTLSEPDRSGQTITTQLDPPLTFDNDLPSPREHTTQESLTAQTETIDFSIPEPDGGWDTILRSSTSSTSPSHSTGDMPQANNQANLNSNTSELDAWIQTHLKQNIPPNLITQALKSTTMDPILATAILDDLVAGKGIPSDVPGVWAGQDDEDLGADDGRRVKRVLEKHGAKNFNERWSFLEEWGGA